MFAPSGEITPRGQRVKESIIHAQFRPVLMIRDNALTGEFIGPDSAVWRDRLMASGVRANLDRVIRSVGRVEISNNVTYDWVGTGWLVAEDIVVTNRHVAGIFARSEGARYVFRRGYPNGTTQSARIDFLEEHQRQLSLEFAVESVLWIAEDLRDQPDMAFLRVRRTSGDRSLSSPVRLAERAEIDQVVVTIGYPAQDPDFPDQDLVRQVFGEVYDKKRLAPGQVTKVSADEIEHDCSTLGGNSGSPVIDIETGLAVGLHFAGLFGEANYAVPSSVVAKKLLQLQRGTLVPPVAVESQTATASLTNAATSQTSPSPGVYEIQTYIPVKVQLTIGDSVQTFSTPAAVRPLAGVSDAEGALATARQELLSRPEVIDVRLGYRFKRGWITDERVIVVETKEKLSLPELRKQGMQLLPQTIGGLGVDVRTAPLTAQLAEAGVDVDRLLELPRPGAYCPPSDVSLERVKERMKACFHASPDAGFENLKAFLGRVTDHMTATMYEWEADHITQEIVSAISPGDRRLKMVVQQAGTQGTVTKVARELGNRFQYVWASVGSGKIVPKAYHIKVASRDGEEFWLSSGNWKDSNQPNISPAADGDTRITPLRTYNRDWHAVIANKKLAVMFQKFIEWDFEEAQRLPVEEGLAAALPDVFVPDQSVGEELERRGAGRYFKPLELDRVLDVEPLLTPDKDNHGHRIFMAAATELVRTATRTIYVQNQSFDYLVENASQFENFFTTLADKQRSGVEVRIIFRDKREFGASNGPGQQELLERLKEVGLDTDYIKVQMRCHTKAIMVDSSSVMLGSQNLTNTGALYNRDASLLVRDEEVAKYYEEIFLYDWETLATQSVDELVGGMKLARANEAAPAGFRRVNLAEILGLI